MRTLTGDCHDPHPHKADKTCESRSRERAVTFIPGDEATLLYCTRTDASVRLHLSQRSVIQVKQVTAAAGVSEADWNQVKDTGQSQAQWKQLGLITSCLPTFHCVGPRGERPNNQSQTHTLTNVLTRRVQTGIIQTTVQLMSIIHRTVLVQII